MCSNEIKHNLTNVETNIAKACKRAKRERNSVTLIAVSKTKPVSMIEDCIRNGITTFGENKVQELTLKCETLKEHLQWHFIGHLQRNKVKYLINNVELIHSVDTLRLAQCINDESFKRSCITSILIEVNVAGEDSKFGLCPKDTISFVEEIASLKNIKVKGLMTIAPFLYQLSKHSPFRMHR